MSHLEAQQVFLAFETRLHDISANVTKPWTFTAERQSTRAPWQLATHTCASSLRYLRLSMPLRACISRPCRTRRIIQRCPSADRYDHL